MELPSLGRTDSGICASGMTMLPSSATGGSVGSWANALGMARQNSREQSNINNRTARFIGDFSSRGEKFTFFNPDDLG
jgi:hypothetical protein